MGQVRDARMGKQRAVRQKFLAMQSSWSPAQSLSDLTGAWHVVADKYEDVAGLVLPKETLQYLDGWKRPEELVQNSPDIPIIIAKPPATPIPAADETKAKGAPGNSAWLLAAHIS
jgi:hypothetical protein